MFLDCPLKALHDDWRERYRSVVVKAGDFGLFGDGDDGGCLETCLNNSLGEGKVENVC